MDTCTHLGGGICQSRLMVGGIRDSVVVGQEGPQGWMDADMRPSQSNDNNSLVCSIVSN